MSGRKLFEPNPTLPADETAIVEDPTAYLNLVARTTSEPSERERAAQKLEEIAKATKATQSPMKAVTFQLTRRNHEILMHKARKAGIPLRQLIAMALAPYLDGEK